MKTKTSGFSSRNGEIILKAPLRNRITKPLKIYFPAEIAILKNGVNSIFQKHLLDRIVTGPAEILILFRIFSENRLLYKRFYKNIYRPFLLSTIPYFHSTFKNFFIIYATTHRGITHFFLPISPPNYCAEHKKAAIPQNRCILSASIQFII